MPDLPENEKAPNVLTRDEAALLVKANEQPRPDSDEEAARFSAILDRLAEWAEQPEAEQPEGDDEGWREATDEDIAAGGTLVPEQPAPPNLAEKLRERQRSCDEQARARPPRYARSRAYLFGCAHAHGDLADDLDNAIEPEVWGELIACRNELQIDGEVDDYPGLLRWVAAIDSVIARLCPPEIAQQHGWEPRREEADHGSE